MKHPGGSGGGAGHSAKHTRSEKHRRGGAKHNPRHHRQQAVQVTGRHPRHARGAS
jgi:hypothetical protein